MTTRPTLRTAFTLVELLIVMTVIGILVGMLAVAIVPALKRTNEFAIVQEMTQIERAVENFKTKYGFYPPSFIRILNNDVDGNGTTTDDESIAALLTYINRIAPNHSETAINPTTNNTYIFDWWDQVGREIDYSTGQDLVFWLAGLAKNKQRPVSSDGEKEVFYEFKASQLEFIGDDTIVYSYLQPKGKTAPFLYIDNSSYGYGPSIPASQGGPIFFDGYSNVPGVFNGMDFVLPQANGGNYENPKSFQIVTFGMDGLPGAPWEPNAVNRSNFTTDWHQYQSGAAADNLCNFAEGRLERMLLGTTN